MCGILGIVLAEQNLNVAPELFEGAMFYNIEDKMQLGLPLVDPKVDFINVKVMEWPEMFSLNKE